MTSAVLIHSQKDANQNLTGFYDRLTYETVANLHPVIFYDDFLESATVVPAALSGVDGYPWVSKIVGAAPPTVAAVANTANGVVALTLTADSQAQSAGLYFGDAMTFDMNKGAIFEARVAYHVLPTTGVTALFGLQSAYAAPASVSFYSQFASTASGLVNYQTKDGVNTVSTSTANTVVADAFHIYRIDATDPKNVVFSIDGNVITSKAAFVPATASNAVLQPMFLMYKASGTGIGTMYIDYVKIASNRA